MGPRAVLGAGVAVLGMLVTATPAAADPAGSFADAKVTMSCDAVTADGSVVELFVEADPQGTVRESYLEVIGQDGEHLALGTPVHTALGGGVVEVTHDLADSEGASLGTAHLRGTLTAGEPVLSRDTWRDNGGQWHSVMLVTPYAVSWDTIEVGSFDLDGLDCTSRQVDYETRWSESHRRVFSGQEVTPAEGCAVAPMTHLSVGLLPDNVEVSFGTGDG
ncbi:MAG: hypothetical protein ACRDV2_05405, partial [Actinomycetes bacterium]